MQDQTEDDVRSLLGIPTPKGFCTAGPVAHLSQRADSKRRKVSRFSCHRWGCPVCGQRKRLAIGRHVAGKLLLANGALFHRRYEPDEWAGGKRWMQRHGCSWVRIGHEGTAGDVIGVIPVPDGEKVTVYGDPDGLIRLLGLLLREVEVVGDSSAIRYRPVSWSWDWKLPPGSKPEYERVTWLRNYRSPDQVVECLRSHGIEATKRPGIDGDGWDVVFTLREGQEIPDSLTTREPPRQHHSF